LLATELRGALERKDAAAEQLSDSLAKLLDQVEGLEAATDDLRVHLLNSFEELRAQHRTVRGIAAGQRDQTRYLEEIVDRLRFLMRERGDGPTSQPDASMAIAPVLVPGATRRDAGWRGGAEITVGDNVYLIHDVLLEEQTVFGGSALSRQARARRLVPRTDDRYVWLRQVEVHRGVSEARGALTALSRERDLLARIGEPRVSQFIADGRTTTLAVHWPISKAANHPCETLDPSVSYETVRLLGGFAGLCELLARLHRLDVAHRFLTPERIVVDDDGRLSLLDLGLAGHDYSPGEGPAGCQAPEQRRRGMARPCPATDVYQLAAIVYHLLTGHPPHVSSPLPLRSQAPDIPEPAGQAIDMALSTEPAARPPISSLGAALRMARDDL
jgi:hypothetical protein